MTLSACRSILLIDPGATDGASQSAGILQSRSSCMSASSRWDFRIFDPEDELIVNLHAGVTVEHF